MDRDLREGLIKAYAGKGITGGVPAGLIVKSDPPGL